MDSVITVSGMSAVTPVHVVTVVTPFASDAVNPIVMSPTTSDYIDYSFSPFWVTPIAPTPTASVLRISSNSATTSCGPIHQGYGPKPDEDSAKEFYDFEQFDRLALDQFTPEHYDRVYVNQHASSVSEKLLESHELETYSAVDCSERCDRTEGCKAFNIFFERTPTLNLGEDCPDSSSSTTIKCCLYGGRLDKRDATNRGYGLYDFRVTISGSNAYNKEYAGSKDDEKEGPSENVAPIVVVSVSVVLVFLALTSSTALKYLY